MADRITLGRYMWERIHQIGCTSIFGVPGDFNLQFLDSIFLTPGLSWVGNQNELNAAYAADGYARVKGVPGCLVTTHGVGELSALNGIAGSMSEHIPIIHVVGQTTRAMQSNHMMIHHSIGQKPDHQLYNKASVPLRFAAAELWDLETAPGEIDRVIRECVVKSGPVYIFLPLDLSAEMVDAKLLDTPIDLKPTTDEKKQAEAVDAISKALAEAKHPILLVDVLTRRFRAVEETRQLARRLGVPIFASNMGKGIVDETEEMYGGVWMGQVSSPGVLDEVKKADLVITLGYLPADTNSGGFSRKLDEATTIRIDPHEATVKGKNYSEIAMKTLLDSLLEALPEKPQHAISKPHLPAPRVPNDNDKTNLTQSYIWSNISTYLSAGDIILGETGTSNFGIYDILFPSHLQYEAQIYYGSIGWAAAATFGADVAHRELLTSSSHRKDKGRTVLFTGDGSLALTIQEIGSMVKHKSTCVVFVINNEGYTVERMIWGARQIYNDIVPTSYKHLLPLYNHPDPTNSYHRVTTKAEFDQVLKKPQIVNPENVQLVELVVEKLDTSWRLGAQLAVRGEEARKYLKEEGFHDAYGNWGLSEEAMGGTGVSWK
ncbi:pyruvate decarboxylase-like protein [Paraphaeosphaeria sporulosa]|uniref:Pyruvate decarboxylase n=1 Tax=Paraphaeosphaeria sporulosa TaxID=1460663 RepID=A0A177CI64_9PLEO|nr:pyruvate decarboxylase-like protein [Paraphaeosphaeria sporulosa]OAG06520.1 pyruvate decarboxylase-like protein [Paraphaeosphaeria sporulosa]